MKKINKFSLLTALLFAALLLIQCQKPYEITEANVSRIIKTLSADDMRGRHTFSPDIKRAAAFIENEFKDINLEPLDGLNSYQQPFNVYSITPENISLKINGREISREDYFLLSDSESVNWKKEDVRIENIDKNDNFRARYSALSNASEPVVVLINPEHKQAFGRYHRFYSGATRKTTIGTGADILFVLSNQTLQTLEFSAQNDIEAIEIANVAGQITGNRTDEIVLFSAHYDHIGIRPAVDGDSIANGANDDASGVAGVIELARHYKSMGKPERTLMFVAFTGEEVGGYGSKYFSEQLNPDQITAMFNIEMIGKPAVEGPNTAWITGFERTDFGEILQKSAEGSIYTFYPDPYPQQNLFFRSDNATLARLGVPAHSISTTPIDVDPDYHQVTDEFETLDMPHTTNTIRAISKGAEGIISGKYTPTRVDVSTIDR